MAGAAILKHLKTTISRQRYHRHEIWHGEAIWHSRRVPQLEIL